MQPTAVNSICCMLLATETTTTTSYTPTTVSCIQKVTSQDIKYIDKTQQLIEKVMF